MQKKVRGILSVELRMYSPAVYLEEGQTGNNSTSGLGPWTAVSTHMAPSLFNLKIMSFRPKGRSFSIIPLDVLIILVLLLCFLAHKMSAFNYLFNTLHSIF